MYIYIAIIPAGVTFNLQLQKRQSKRLRLSDLETIQKRRGDISKEDFHVWKKL